MRSPSRKPSQPQSQAVDLFLTIAEALGVSTDRELAALADVSLDSIPHWRLGAVREFKTQTLAAIKEGLLQRLRALQEGAEAGSAAKQMGLHPLVVEAGSSPDDLHRQFRERIAFDYLGHRFLYYEPQGAIAWLNLIQTGYDQDAWLSGVQTAAREWLMRAEKAGKKGGGLAQALDRRNASRAVELIALGSGDGAKEVALLRELARALPGEPPTFVPIDVSIPLLLRAAVAGREALTEEAGAHHAGRHHVLPFCADFEEGPLTFLQRLPSAALAPERSVRLVTLLGNVFGNLRDEDRFVRHKLARLTRPGDLVWLEVALRLDPLTDDPLYAMTERRDEETASDANRRLLIEGPFRRWEAATGRASAQVDLRVSLRDNDDTCRVPGSVNFCHDLLIGAERRACTMLFSRRYTPEGLIAWLEERAFAVERIHTVRDSRRRPRVAHLLLSRKAA